MSEYVPQQHSEAALDLPRRGGAQPAPGRGQPQVPRQSGGRREGGGWKAALEPPSPLVQQTDLFLLEAHEELAVCKYYEKRLLDFCSVFKPAMPRSVVGSACMYFKRFYLNNSVMEYHPRIIMLTCAFLACKVDEFNVSSAQFVSNLRESPVGQEKALEQILEYELLLIQQLNFHLIVHNPYRPFEGFLIDLKTRYPLLENPETLRKTADDFLNRVALTDACLLYTPSQIALIAILSSASRAGINMESYLSESLMLKENKASLNQLLDGMK
ncbi:cyclin-H isoform X5 [Sceloporus undulatus]|nr:cyclin-H isoform X4 [Sceloporus undulatus]XP_042307357.1 cyclin-H isoform X5 [Sceloporus undulatus]